MYDPWSEDVIPVLPKWKRAAIWCLGCSGAALVTGFGLGWGATRLSEPAVVLPPMRSGPARTVLPPPIEHLQLSAEPEQRERAVESAAEMRPVGQAQSAVKSAPAP